MSTSAVALANPLTLAQRYVEQPIESEVQNLLSGLTDTADTLARALPATPKRSKPTTRSPLGV